MRFNMVSLFLYQGTDNEESDEDDDMEDTGLAAKSKQSSMIIILCDQGFWSIVIA